MTEIHLKENYMFFTNEKDVMKAGDNFIKTVIGEEPLENNILSLKIYKINEKSLSCFFYYSLYPERLKNNVLENPEIDTYISNALGLLKSLNSKVIYDRVK